METKVIQNVLSVVMLLFLVAGVMAYLFISFTVGFILVILGFSIGIISTIIWLATKKKQVTKTAK